MTFTLEAAAVHVGGLDRQNKVCTCSRPSIFSPGCIGRIHERTNFSSFSFTLYWIMSGRTRSMWRAVLKESKVSSFYSKPMILYWMGQAAYHNTKFTLWLASKQAFVAHKQRTKVNISWTTRFLLLFGECECTPGRHVNKEQLPNNALSTMTAPARSRHEPLPHPTRSDTRRLRGDHTRRVSHRNQRNGHRDDPNDPTRQG
ncbi:hypothetical protein IWX90DRAFT_241409 [Phyllosticta citrichinensis]|uniref:Uncharacterized protein n=1 Tax=Phyllosticta citrichinensis TaxID=1130410 RepID=A0ABR1XQB9_9PEZI